MPTADLLRLAELLDGAGFAYLEVSGGGVFDTAVRRGVESPWERIRALKARTKTPLALALRGRFLVGSRPVGGDFARRFVASAAASGIDIFRLHDPLNDVDCLWEAADLVDEHIGDEPVAPVPPRIAVRAAQRKLPVGLVAALDVQLRGQASGDRLDEVLDEVDKVRTEVGSPPLAAPIGQIVASQALLNVLTANRYSTMVDELRDLVEGRFGRTPAPVDPALLRAVELIGNGRESPPPIDLDELREQAEGLAASEEELLLLALF